MLNYCEDSFFTQVARLERSWNLNFKAVLCSPCLCYAYAILTCFQQTGVAGSWHTAASSSSSILHHHHFTWRRGKEKMHLACDDGVNVVWWGLKVNIVLISGLWSGSLKWRGFNGNLKVGVDEDGLCCGRLLLLNMILLSHHPPLFCYLQAGNSSVEH